ncbi:MAG TPA: hypothetical protein P5248_06070, partial [Bacteroidales bacterium]|nr:hypothetical protein [Bacteroidales bacterium]
VNLGQPFNTPGDEMAPTATDSSAGLWFSSDGHPGLGGQDLFFSNGGFNQWDRPYNLGLPFNSPADDFWYRPSGPARPGLLVSNRAGSQSHTGETCCYDIYLHRASDKVLLARPPDSLTLVKRLAAERLNALLPLELYFDNDRPDPASTADTTLASYSALLQDYLSRERVFEQAYAAGLSQPEVARDSVRRFMESEVRPSGPKLDSLLRHLAGLLPEGYGVTLVLRGYASPLNTPEYNEKLAGRRVASVRNEMMQWKAGELAVWIGQPDGLRITEVPMGERAGLHNVSDDPADPRNSVYSPAASRERKVSILYGMVDGQTGLWGGIPTTVRLRLTEPMPETLRDGEHRVLRLILANEGTSVFYCRGVSVSDPAAEAVISGNRVEPGQEADLFLLLRGPLGHETPDIRLTVYGNLYEDPYTIVLRNQ